MNTLSQTQHTTHTHTLMQTLTHHIHTQTHKHTRNHIYTGMLTYMYTYVQALGRYTCYESGSFTGCGAWLPAVNSLCKLPFLSPL